jgi:predicted transcriptional regulator
MSDLQKYIDDNLDNILEVDNNKDTEKQLGESIKQKRINANMSQIELSKKSGIQQSSISKIEKGHANLTIKQLKKIADALNSRIIIRLE